MKTDKKIEEQIKEILGRIDIGRGTDDYPKLVFNTTIKGAARWDSSGFMRNKRVVSDDELLVEELTNLLNTKVQKAVENTLKDFVDFMVNEKIGFPTARSKEEAFRIQRDMYGVVIKTYLQSLDKGEQGA